MQCKKRPMAGLYSSSLAALLASSLPAATPALAPPPLAGRGTASACDPFASYPAASSSSKRPQPQACVASGQTALPRAAVSAVPYNLLTPLPACDAGAPASGGGIPQPPWLPSPQVASLPRSCSSSDADFGNLDVRSWGLPGDGMP